jgi:uncharacterized protein
MRTRTLIVPSLLLPVLFLAGCEDEAPATAAKTSAAQTAPTTGCGAPATLISEVQGNDEQSELLGRSVSVQAVVTFAAVDALGGIFVQEEREDRDGEPNTSEALFVTADSKQAARVGDTVRVTGVVSELGDPGKTMTALSALSEFRVCGEGKLPNETSIEQAPLVVSDWERFEAMRVHIDAPLTVLDNSNLRRSGELLVSLNGRQFTPTELVSPGEEARKHEADNLRHRLVLDDASLAQSPKKVSYLTTPIAPEAPYRIGTRLGEVRGILDQRLSSENGGLDTAGYRVHVVSQLVAEQAVRPRMPPEVNGKLRIVSFNMLNWFNGDGKGAGFENSRGARSAEQAKDQRDKLVAALSAMKPDIAALMEVENDGDDKLNALSEFVQALNRQSGLGYQIAPSPEPKLGGDQIKVAFIYRAKVVQIKGPAATIASAPFDNFNRPPLAQSFQQGRDGGVITVVANHFKSKGCGDPALLDEANKDKGDGQACFNAKRVEASKALAAWIKTDPTQSNDSDVLLLGDFNAYALEEPIRVLNDQGFATLGGGKEPHYSFNFRGASGSLDHALASESLRKQVKSAKVWHINADEYPGFDYLSDATGGNEQTPLTDEQKRANAESRTRLFRRTAFRSSDHDPLIVGVTLENNQTTNVDAK